MVTLPLIYALQISANSSLNGHQSKVQAILSGENQNEKDILETVDWVTHNDNIERARETAYTYAEKARQNLLHFPASHDRNILDELIDFVVQRKQ